MMRPIHLGSRPSSRSPNPARRALTALALALTAAASACGAPSAPVERPTAKTTCDPDRLDACERALARSLATANARVPQKLAADYAQARAARDPSDPWAALWRDFTAAAAASPQTAAILEETSGPSHQNTPSQPGTPRRILTPPLPTPAAIAKNDLLLAMADAAGLRHLIHIAHTPAAPAARVTQLFPADPLAPFMAGLPPILRDDNAPAHLPADIALAASLRNAIEAASTFRYVDAARETDTLTALVNQHPDPLAEPVLRARYAIQLLTAAGIALDPQPDAQSPPPEPGPPAPGDTPYGDLLRVRIARDQSAAWTARAPSILPAIPADRRPSMNALFQPPTDCSTAAPPPMDAPRDLVFASRLSLALARPAGPPQSPASVLPLPEWYRRYETLVRLVEQTRATWAYAPSLLYERGETYGLSPAATTTHQRVTELADKHLRAIEELETAYPLRYRALNQLALIYSPGVLADEKLRADVIRISQATVRDKLARATDAERVFEAALTGLFAGMSYPPAIQEAHFLAFQGAFTAKLRGDLTTRTGWGVAGLYAADAAARLVMGQTAGISPSLAQIPRALRDPTIPRPALAALATSVARYAQLGVDGRLDAEQTNPDRFPPDRRAARDALKNAIAGLGEKDEAPASVVDDVATLADGLIAALSISVTSAREAPPDTCPDAASKGPTPAVRRAIARLGDVRRRIFLNPRYKTGDGPWVRRARLLVTLLSDAMDIVGKTGDRPAFTIPSREAEQSIAAGLRDWDEREAADALAGGYALTRDLLAAKNADRFVQTNAQNLRRVFGGLARFFRSGAPDASGAPGAPGARPSSGVALLDAIASMPLAPSADADLLSLFLSYADTFYARKQPDHADLWILATLVLTGLTDSPPSPRAVDLAAKNASRVEWALRFLTEIARARRGLPPDPTQYASAMRKAGDDACRTGNADAVIDVMGAIRDFASGQRKEARATLDRILQTADARGLLVPKMTYTYEEKTETKAFNVSLGVSYGGGLLEGSNTFQMGLGLRSRGEPGGSMIAALTAGDTAQGGDETARYYVHASALAAAYHFLEGDREHASAAARRAISALIGGVRLGTRAITAANPVAWGADARALLAIDAQLAAEAGLPFLAGDLWTVLRASLPKTADDKAIAAILAKAPIGLAAIKEGDAVRERAARSLKILAAPLACTDAKVELGGFEETSCEAYPLALSLRIADVLKRLPRLRPGEGSKSRGCGVLRTLDAFLAAADKGTYDPDAFTSAFEELRADGRLYDTAILLARHRRGAHCNPAILAAARALGRTESLGPELRADVLSTAVNCALPSTDPRVIEDIAALDAMTQRLPDPSRNLQLLLFVTDLSVRQNTFGALARLASAPDFVSRWMTVNPTAAAAALLIEHAVTTLTAEGPIDSERTRAPYSLLCETFPPGDRAELCGQLRSLRPPFKMAADARQRLAKDALQKLVAQATQSTSKPAP